MTTDKKLEIPHYEDEANARLAVWRILFQRAFSPEWEAGPSSATRCVVEELALWSPRSLREIRAILQSDEFLAMSEQELESPFPGARSDYLVEYAKMTRRELIDFCRDYLAGLLD